MPTHPTGTPPVESPPLRLVTLVEASWRSGVSEDTIRRRVKDGTIPAVLLANKYRIREDHLVEWMSTGAVAT